MNAEEARDLKNIHDFLRNQAVEIDRTFQKNDSLTEKIIAERDQEPSGYTALAVKLGKSDVLAQVGRMLIDYMKKHNVQ